MALNRARGSDESEQIDGEPVQVWSAQKSGGVLFAACTNVQKTSNNDFR